MMDTFSLKRGNSPIIVSIPHCGTFIPDEIATRMSDAALTRVDTDWHVDRLYEFLEDMNVTVLAATHSRYVIDLNRPPHGKPLYPGQTETALCPSETFAGEPLYRDGTALSPTEIVKRLEVYWQPYHEALAAELARLKDENGCAILWDAHSIANQVPRLFEGRLPDFNFGTYDGRACDQSLVDKVIKVAETQTEFDHVLNGRFKGGYITRNFGQPSKGIHAIQLELSQATYMNQSLPFDYREDLVAKVQPVIREFFRALLSAH